MSFVLIVFIAVLCYLLYQCIGAELPPLFTLLMVALILYFGYLVYLNIEADTMALWNDIKSAAAATGDYAAASWNDLLDGMTAWGWVGFGLSLVIVILLGSAIAWPSGRALAAVEVGRLKRERDKAREEASRERDKAKQAEQAAAQDRKDAELAKSLMESAERRAQGLEGQLASAVDLADDRGKQLSEIREKKREAKGRLPKK